MFLSNIINYSEIPLEKKCRYYSTGVYNDSHENVDDLPHESLSEGVACTRLCHIYLHVTKQINRTIHIILRLLSP